MQNTSLNALQLKHNNTQMHWKTHARTHARTQTHSCTGAYAEFGRGGLHGVRDNPWRGSRGQRPLRGAGAEPLHVGDFSELKVSRTLYYAFLIIVGLPLLQPF